MKTTLFHSVSVLISMTWLVTTHQTFNPISLKGPEFLKFYLIFLAGFYISFFALKFLGEHTSKTTFYFMIFIFLIGIIKLIKGVTLGKPVGYLIMILIMETIVILIFRSIDLNNKIK